MVFSHGFQATDPSHRPIGRRRVSEVHILRRITVTLRCQAEAWRVFRLVDSMAMMNHPPVIAINRWCKFHQKLGGVDGIVLTVHYLIDMWEDIQRYTEVYMQ